jgi:hypothetical protein
MPVATAKPCEVHRLHWTPFPTYNEQHHVVPQAWQRFWRPRTSIPEQRRIVALNDVEQTDEEFETRMAAVDLFDPRIVVVCRTGHGNIHFWLTAMMHVFDDNGVLDDPVAGNVEKIVAWLGREAQKRLAPRAGRKDLAVAKLAIIRWVQAGGSVRALCDKGLFGII